MFDSKIQVSLIWGPALPLGFVVLPLSLFLKLSGLILLSLIVSFIYAVLSPLSGLIILIPLLSWFSYVDFLIVSPWNYLLVATLLGAGLRFYLLGKYRNFSLSYYTYALIYFTVFFITYLYVISLYNGDPIDENITVVARLLSFLLLALVSAFLVSSHRNITAISTLFVTTISISALAGIFQFFHVESFWRLRELFPVLPAISDQIELRARITGLAQYNIPLTYQLVLATPLAFALYWRQKKSIEKLIYFLIFFLLIFSVFATLSRSAAAATLISIFIVYSLLSSIKKIIGAFLLLLTGVLGIIVINGILGGAFDRLLTTEKIYLSSFDRIPIQKIALDVAFSHPLGMAKQDLDIMYNKFFSQFVADLVSTAYTYKPERISELSYYLKAKNGVPAPHNQFLNILVRYGFPAFFALILFYIFILCGLIITAKKGLLPDTKILALGLFGSTIGYIIHSLVHNNGPFLEDPLAWIPIGLSFSLFVTLQESACQTKKLPEQNHA